MLLTKNFRSNLITNFNVGREKVAFQDHMNHVRDWQIKSSYFPTARKAIEVDI